MLLTSEEESALDGAKGDEVAAAYRILVAIGEATGAQRLVPVSWAHVSGVNFNTIGKAGADFLENFSAGARSVIRTTINPMGYDPARPPKLGEEFLREQRRIVSSYERLGVTRSFTCTPYEVFELPPKGSMVSFAESNAAVFSNSILGLRTNKESALSALASSVTGKAPLSDLRLEELRHPKVGLRVGYEFSSELDYGLLGYFAGKEAERSCVAISGVTVRSKIDAKALSAGMGTSGSCGMFSMGKASEEIAFDRKERDRTRDELNTAERGDVIALGSPQLGMEEMGLLADLTKGKKFTRRCMIFCSSHVRSKATRTGLVAELERAGAEVLCDSCTCLTPYVSRDEVDSVVTNSAKAAYYFNKNTKVGVSLQDFKSITSEYMS